MTNSASFSINWGDKWDAELGLWRQEGGGHTAPVAKLPEVHSGPNAACRLLLAAEVDQLGQLEAHRLLTNLRRMQVQDGSVLHGCFKWYWEEEKPRDTNAAFFTGLSLIVLKKCYGDKLDPACRSLLDEIFRDLAVWFARSLHEKTMYYPNKFLGDLVCNWLLLELTGRTDLRDEAAAVMLECAAYWHRHGWGWGEHMSDVYGLVCIDELSVLLLFAEQLPAPVRAAYRRLFRELLSIEDRFGAGPRVPAIRSYSFLKSPEHRNYREHIKPLSGPLDLNRYGNHPQLGAIFHAQGWHKLAPKPAAPARDLRIRCFAGSEALARVEADLRLGGMTRYPVMPVADYPTWGLSWQSMPMAFWRPEGDWGFLQWETVEDGQVRSHPAEYVKTAYLGNALTRSIVPPVTGRTFSLLQNGNLLVLRLMPAVPTAWERLSDRLRLINSHAELEEKAAAGVWSQLLLRYPQRTLGVQCFRLTEFAVPAELRCDGVAAKSGPAENAGRLELKQLPEKRVDWELNYSRAALEERRLVVTLWGFSLEGEVTAAPVLTPAARTPAVPRAWEEKAWDLEWHWPGTTWHLHLDPLSPTPLQTTLIHVFLRKPSGRWRSALSPNPARQEQDLRPVHIGKCGLRK